MKIKAVVKPGAAVRAKATYVETEVFTLLAWPGQPFGEAGGKKMGMGKRKMGSHPSSSIS